MRVGRPMRGSGWPAPPSQAACHSDTSPSGSSHGTSSPSGSGDQTGSATGAGSTGRATGAGATAGRSQRAVGAVLEGLGMPRAAP